MSKYILAIDQGTSGTKSIIFDEAGQLVARGSVALHTDHFDTGFVEQDPQDIYQNVLDSVRLCLKEFTAQGYAEADLAACGISNQRETFMLWDAEGKPVSPAVVWACKRSVGICTALKAKGQEAMIQEKTGLIIDPYFSGTKLLWLLEDDASLKQRVEAGEIYFGTVDTWLLYRLTDGQQFKTDHTNACRTLLFNIHTLTWDQEILKMWGLENLQLPEVIASSGDFGASDFNGLLPKVLPVNAMIGDSHAATFGEGCFESGMAKVTLGTGSSILMNTGSEAVQSDNGMLTTICFSLGNRVDYALEGAIVACGSTIEWLKNELQLFDDARQTEAMALAVENNAGVYLVPAFSGLGAPHWQMDRKASLHGMTFGTTRNHIVRAALESIPYQIKDVIAAMSQDMQSTLREIAINGGIANNQFVIRFLVDLLGLRLRKRQNADVSALGAAYLAGLQSNVYQSIEQLVAFNRDQAEFLSPDLSNQQVSDAYRGWQEVLSST